MPLVNNPGGGNCGYYAFSVAIIEIIQQQLLNGHSRLLELLNAQLPELAQKFEGADFAQFSLAAYANDYGNYQRPFLNQLQTSLRQVALAAYKQQLHQVVVEEHLRQEESVSLVEGNETFMNFMKIVRALQTGRALSRQEKDFNELAHSEAIQALAVQVVAEFKAQAQPSNALEQDKCLVQIAKERFKQDTVVEIDGDYIPNPDSTILASLDKISESGYWATHSHLKKIAEVLQVNLAINGHNCGEMAKAYPTVVLNNSSNVHWTTEVQSLTAVQAAKAEVSTPTLSEEEQAVFDAATKPARDNGIQKGVLIEYIEFLVRYAKDDGLFAVNASDSIDEKLAKQLQAEELEIVGLRPKKN